MRRRAPWWCAGTSRPSSTAQAVSTKSESEAVCDFQPKRPIRLSFSRLTRPAISEKPRCLTLAAASMSLSVIESISPAPKSDVGLRWERVIANGPIWFWIGDVLEVHGELRGHQRVVSRG